MAIFSSRKQVEEHLNDLYDFKIVLEKTEHCWAGSDKIVRQQKSAKALAYQGKYGTILKKFDPTAFYQECNDLMR